MGLRFDRRPGPSRSENRREPSPRHHAGAQERLLLRPRSQDGEIHFRRAAAENHLGQRPRSKYRPPHHQSRRAFRHHAGHHLAGPGRRPRLAGHVLQPANRTSSTSRPERPPASPISRLRNSSPNSARTTGESFSGPPGRARMPMALRLHRLLHQRRRRAISCSPGILRRKRNAGALLQPVAAAR